MFIVNLHTAIIEHPHWFTAERLPNFLSVFGKFFINIQDWALKKVENNTERELQKLQIRRLRRLIVHAYKTVPFWRERLDSVKIKPSSIETFEDFSKIPIVNKKIYQNYSEEMLISHKIQKSRLYPVTSFGTTGRPFRFYIDSWCRERRAVTRFRAYRWQGAKPSDIYLKVVRNALFYERSIVLKAADFAALPKVKETLCSIKDSSKCVLDSYPSFLNFIANLIHLDHKTLPLRCVIASAESLSQLEMEGLQQIFQCQVGKRYTSREGGGTIAQTCHLGTFHINIDQVYIEIVDVEGRPVEHGKPGKILLTNLNEFAMPFIRYELGDLGYFPIKPCPCGSQFPAFNFEGRDVAVFKLPDGRLLHSFSIISLLHVRREWIQHYQLVRVTMNSFEVFIVPKSDYFPGDVESLREQLEELFGDNVNFSIKLVSSIEVLHNTRFRPFVSMVEDDQGLGRLEKFQ